MPRLHAWAHGTQHQAAHGRASILGPRIVKSLGFIPANTIEVVYQFPELPHIKAPVTWTEAEQVNRMIERWAFFHPDADGIPRDGMVYIPDQLFRHLSVTASIIRIEAEMNPTRAKRVLWLTAKHLLTLSQT